MSEQIPERPEDVAELFRLYDGPCYWEELAQAADCGDLIDLAKSAKDHISLLETTITGLTAKLERTESDLCDIQQTVLSIDGAAMMDTVSEKVADLAASIRALTQQDTPHD